MHKLNLLSGKIWTNQLHRLRSMQPSLSAVDMGVTQTLVTLSTNGENKDNSSQR